MTRAWPAAAALLSALLLAACGGGGPDTPLARTQLGDIVPDATPEQRAMFARGRALAQRRFTAADGHGPAFNVDACAACHEKPVLGGSAGRYRNFNLVATRDDGSGAFRFTGSNGIQRQFTLAAESRVASDPDSTIIALRNPVPFFGVGALARVGEEVILAGEDPMDADGDGISGRANFDRGRVGRFGRKAQSASVEDFIRGPLFNHLGITTDPLPPRRRIELGLPVARAAPPGLLDWLGLGRAHAQAPSGDRPTVDDDGIPDPELGEQALADLVAFTLLLAPPQAEVESPAARAGEQRFLAAGCHGCHRPELPSPDGPVRAYTDLLLHDMGPELADGIEMGALASGSEFRTQPLWGIAAAAPYLHDGRADTLDQAIRLHGGEAAATRDAYLALDQAARDELLAFLDALGGAAQRSDGLLPPDAGIPEANQYGAPNPGLSAAELARFSRGRALFDRDFQLAEGLGPLFNGDACRACHFDPVIGGSGPIDVNVVRHGRIDAAGAFSPPPGGTILHRHSTVASERANDASSDEANVFELRQTPALFGLGLIERIPEMTILALADPDDADGDGISGRAHRLPDGRLGRFGWKAQVPDLRAFARDASSAELGLSVPQEAGAAFGTSADEDAVADPELDPAALADMTFFMRQLAPPPRSRRDPAVEDAGAAVFDRVGCGACHVATLHTADGLAVNLFSDLLLHDVLADGEPAGIVDGDAGVREFRTPPLWGLARTAPYMHDGRSATVAAAITRHGGEAQGAVAAYQALDAGERAALIAFLESL